MWEPISHNEVYTVSAISIYIAMLFTAGLGIIEHKVALYSNAVDCHYLTARL